MNLPQKVYDNIVALHAKYPNLAHGSEDDRRALTKIIGEQNCFDLGNVWGIKSRGPGSPQSKDTCAFKYNNVGCMYIWDVQNGTTLNVSVHPGEVHHYDVCDQMFIECNPVNHLGSIVVPPNPNPPNPEPLPPSDIEAKLNLILNAQLDMVQVMRETNKMLTLIANNINPDMVGRMSGWAGGNITLTPKK